MNLPAIRVMAPGGKLPLAPAGREARRYFYDRLLAFSLEPDWLDVGGRRRWH